LFTGCGWAAQLSIEAGKHQRRPEASFVSSEHDAVACELDV